MAPRYYLYGIFPAPGPTDLDIEGLDKQTVRSQQLDDFTFLFSDACQNRYLASRKNLLGHERVLETAMQHGFHTLLPLQFGLTIEDWQQVQQDLDRTPQDELGPIISALAGQRREVSIKIMWDATSELELLMEENQESTTPAGPTRRHPAQYGPGDCHWSAARVCHGKPQASNSRTSSGTHSIPWRRM
jgi:hypothetical protein